MIFPSTVMYRSPLVVVVGLLHVVDMFHDVVVQQWLTRMV